ncbi:type II toxin-antitoxin system VapC family toxin [Amycolatopsis tolypomycina]|uniref:type II toxin-antitoxin system VapC family toxin n=1 Tax=Amycolatopsis tolypomycina TaxID=208445 RepID=UPI0033A53D7E
MNIKDPETERLAAEVAELTGDTEVAIDAFSQYGKGHHPAKLGMGDCDSYATAKLAREPLLCIGDGFPRTDLELVEVKP